MNRVNINHQFEFEQTIIGIVSTAKPFLLIWHINEFLGFSFAYEKEWEIVAKDQTIKHFTSYSFINENTETEHRVIKNQMGGALLIPERKETDFFWVVNKKLYKDDEAYIVKTLNTLEVITTAYSIDVKTMKSRQHLVF